MARIVEPVGTSLSLASAADETLQLTLERESLLLLKERRENLPQPSTQIVSGILDQIKHSSHSFELRIDEKSSISGRLTDEFADMESLRPLWGKKTTVVGLVHFKRNGQAKAIVARQIYSFREGDQYFNEIPNPHPTSRLRNQGVAATPSAIQFDPKRLAGTWLGEESLTDLLDELSRL